MQKLALSRGHYAGYPIPDDRCQLVLAPQAPLYDTMHGATIGEQEEEESDEDFLARLSPMVRERVLTRFQELQDAEIVNYWFCERQLIDVLVWRTKSGRAKVTKLQAGPGKRLDLQLNTIGVSRCWDIEAELKALDKLQAMLPEHSFNYYFMTGSFLESSKRSGVTYIFRRCRPTIALSTRKGSTVSPLCALCLHCIGYYQGSFGGTMVPTDDVITHLTMMRGDERRYWAQCNQHSLWEPQAGV